MKHTKRTLAASGLALVISAALLVGTTFAWFTDSVINTGNHIQSGKLSIGAYAYDLADAPGDDTFTIEEVNGAGPSPLRPRPRTWPKTTPPSSAMKTLSRANPMPSC